METNTALKIGELGKVIKECENILHKINNNKSFTGILRINDSNYFNVTNVGLELTNDNRIKILNFIEEMVIKSLEVKKTDLLKLMKEATE
ncbi:hypothetical protein [Maribacter sp.]|uniref:hypothetical protein n=1 Tax=Maribacter sp. TaxID=1897614 RepID=UPI0025BCDAEC|nr:hypothetical protein [Maribacter sp.]